MGYMTSGMKVARESAWAHFGREYWRWFVFGPVIARLVAGAVTVAGLALGAWAVATHIEGWLAWLGFIASHYLLPMIFVALGVSVYAIIAVIFWRLNGWKWKLGGFSTVRYTLVTMSLLVICMTLVGVTAV